MDFRLIFSTFFVIFLAELGDKTQLAAMAAAAGSNKPLSILIGSVLALVLSSVLAVTLGDIIAKYIPMQYVKIAAGILFIIFGLIYLQESAPKKEKNILAQSVLKTAQSFERQELSMLTAIKKQLHNPKYQAAIQTLIDEDSEHLSLLENISVKSAINKNQQLQEKPIPTSNDPDRASLTILYERQSAMADFYRIMSEKALVPPVKNALAKLHREEELHVEKIRALFS